MILYAFDLLELDGADLRRLPLIDRKAVLGKVPARGASGIELSADGVTVFRHACRLGCEGDRVEAARLALSLRPREDADQGQKPGARMPDRSEIGHGSILAIDKNLSDERMQLARAMLIQYAIELDKYAQSRGNDDRDAFRASLPQPKAGP